MDLLMSKINNVIKEQPTGDERAPRPRRLTKEDIGNPTNFRHEAHIGWDTDFSTASAIDRIPRGRSWSEGPSKEESPSKIDDAQNRRPGRLRRINKEEIGFPRDFRHNAHIGWDDFYGFKMESNGEPMDPSVREILRRIGDAMNGGRNSISPITPNRHSQRHSMPLPPVDSPSPPFNPNCVQIFIDDRPEPKQRKIYKPLPPIPVPQADRPLSDCSFFDSTRTRL